MSETPPGVDLDRLRPWFAANVEGATDAPLHASLISGGRSNLTYSVGDATHEWVLRRPPLGHVLPTAHDMTREHTVLAALAGTDVPVPRTLAFCSDEAVNDAPFYVMEKVDGVILRTPEELAQLSGTDARRCSECLIDVLVAIHAVDYRAAGLGEFGHPDGYLERQVRRWGEQWERSKSRDLPAIEELARRLRAALPTSPPPTIVHGDYRLDNTMLAADDPGRIVAVLDWEMATLGDPAFRPRAVPRVLGTRPGHVRGRQPVDEPRRRLPVTRRGRASVTQPHRAATSASSISTRCSRRTSSRSFSKASTRGS